MERFLSTVEHYASHLNVMAWVFIGVALDEGFRENWLVAVLLPAFVALAAVRAHEETCWRE